MKYSFRILAAILGALFVGGGIFFHGVEEDWISTISTIMFGLFFLRYAHKGYIYHENDSYSIDRKKQKKLLLIKALGIAIEVVEGRESPSRGCRQIVMTFLNEGCYAKDIKPFAELADMWDEHNQENENSHDLFKKSIAECERFIEKHRALLGN